MQDTSIHSFTTLYSQRTLSGLHVIHLLSCHVVYIPLHPITTHYYYYYYYYYYHYDLLVVYIAILSRLLLN